MKTNNNSEPRCSAYISKNKNRLKIYEDKNVFLNNMDKFEIELHNAWNVQALAKVYINNKPIYSGGFIINPGQRVFLERFVSKNASFVFETYEVENTQENKNAIEYNGEVRVEFYKESTPIITTNSHFTWNEPIWKTSEDPRITYTSNYSSSIGPNSRKLFSCSADMDNAVYFGDTIKTRSIVDNIETGRICEGEKTNQVFTDGHGSFESYWTNMYIYKILPYSQKPQEFSELKRYCPNCGKKVLPKHKYCSNCGERI